MSKLLFCVPFLLIGCKWNDPKNEVVLPEVTQDTVVVSWSVLSKTRDRRSMHVVLEGDRTLNITTRSADGTMMNVSRMVSKDEYAKLVRTLRALDCCSLQSTTAERASFDEAKPELKIDFGDTRCRITLWDREWRKGRARECGFAVARLHGGGFVPDAPADAHKPLSP